MRQQVLSQKLDKELRKFWINLLTAFRGKAICRLILKWLGLEIWHQICQEILTRLLYFYILHFKLHDFEKKNSTIGWSCSEKTFINGMLQYKITYRCTSSCKMIIFDVDFSSKGWPNSQNLNKSTASNVCLILPDTSNSWFTHIWGACKYFYLNEAIYHTDITLNNTPFLSKNN